MLSKRVTWTWCSMPSQSVQLYQGDAEHQQACDRTMKQSMKRNATFVTPVTNLCSAQFLQVHCMYSFFTFACPNNHQNHIQFLNICTWPNHHQISQSVTGLELAAPRFSYPSPSSCAQGLQLCTAVSRLNAHHGVLPTACIKIPHNSIKLTDTSFQPKPKKAQDLNN